MRPSVSNLTVLRATATFLRTTVTRNTPWDRFLVGITEDVPAHRWRANYETILHVLNTEGRL